jgi:hypothetical protein
MEAAEDSVRAQPRPVKPRDMAAAEPRNRLREIVMEHEMEKGCSVADENEI